MNSQATVQALLAAVQQGGFEHAKALLADDFHFRGTVPEVLNAKAWLAMSASLKAAFPDLDYHFQILGLEADAVNITAQLSGTHTGDFDLTSMLDMGIIPATFKSFAAARQHARLTVAGAQVAAWEVTPTPGAGVLAILQQLDIYITDIVVDRKLWFLPSLPRPNGA